MEIKFSIVIILTFYSFAISDVMLGRVSITYLYVMYTLTHIKTLVLLALTYTEASVLSTTILGET